VTIEQLRRTHRAAPFRPFTIRMADGRQFSIPHPDFLSMSPSGRTAVIYHEDDSASIVDLLLMTELDLSPASTAGA
jgi:hypothetical protein